MMILDSSLKSLILKTFDSNQIKNEALKRKMITLRQDGVQKVLSGISTIEEILRVTQK
jgi:general secretion pathway protein E